MNIYKGLFVISVLGTLLMIIYSISIMNMPNDKNYEMLNEISKRLDSKDSIIAQRDFEIQMLKYDLDMYKHYYTIGKIVNSKGDSVGHVSTTR